jgi:predicted nucleic acid-binding protein
MIFVDTGYLLALARPRDHLHARTMAWAKVAPPPFLTTEYVVVETINGLSNPLDRRKGYVLLDQMSLQNGWQLVVASSDMLARGLAFHRQHADKEWSLTDCISFVVMRQRSVVPALTHDHHFEQAGFEALLRREPP